jgi:hypothetical protein
VNSTAGKLSAMVAFWIAVGLIQTFNHAGIPKAIVMLLVLASAPLLIGVARRSAPLAPAQLRATDICFWIALAVNLVYFAVRVVNPHISDLGTSALAAVDGLLHGFNPYLLPIDPYGPQNGGFTGFKYMPLMIVDYLPLGAAFGQRGVQITNLLLLLACLWLMKRMAGTKLAPLALLMLPLLGEQMFAKGATDLAAVLPLLGALALLARRSFWCGVCVGLSIATKLLPGVAMLPALIPATRRDHFAAGVAVGLLPIAPFLIAGPRDFWGNIVLFNLTRLPDSTSWLHAAPAGGATAAHLVFAVAMLAAVVYVWRRSPPAITRTALAAMLGIAAILAGPGAHHNYQLWWMPFYALALALALAPKGRVGYISGENIASGDT